MTIRDSLLDCDTPFGTIVSYYESHKNDFCNIVFGFVDSNTILHTTILAKVLACFLGKNDRCAVERILKSESYKLPEVLKACQILDSRRLKTQIQKKIKNTSDKYGKFKCELNNLEKLNDGYLKFSFTKSKIQMIKK